MGNLYTFLYIKNEPIITIGINKLSLIIIHEFFLQLSFWLIEFYSNIYELYLRNQPINNNYKIP